MRVEKDGARDSPSLEEGMSEVQMVTVTRSWPRFWAMETGRLQKGLAV